MDQWRSVRNGLLSSPRFQKFAVDFPPFRPVSRSRSRQLFDLLAGFTYSQVLYCTVKLGLIEMLQGQPLSTAAIAARIGESLQRQYHGGVSRSCAVPQFLQRCQMHWLMREIHRTDQCRINFADTQRTGGQLQGSDA